MLMSVFKLKGWGGWCVMGLVCLIALSSCRGPYLAAPKPRARPAPLAQDKPTKSGLRLPTLSRHDLKAALTTQQLMELLREMLMKAAKDDDANRVLCERVNLSKQPRLDALETFASKTTSLLIDRFNETKRRTLSLHPEVNRHLSNVAMAFQLDGVKAVDDGLLWVVTESLITQMCERKSNSELNTSDATAMAMAAVHFMTSTDALYRAYFEVFAKVPGQREAFLWSAHGTASMSNIMKSVTLSQEADLLGMEDGAPTARSVRVVTQSSELGIECRPALEVLDLAGPSMVSVGGDIPRDSQVVFRLHCTNSNNDARLFSESFVALGKPHPCMAEVSSETVLREMDPMQENSMVLGPFLFTEACPLSLSREYRVVSSQYSKEARVRLEMKLGDTKVITRTTAIEEDIPGSSAPDSDVGRLGKGDRAEFQIEATASPNFRYSLMSFEPVLAFSGEAFKTVAEMPLEFVETGKVFRTYDDIDLKVSDGVKWLEHVSLRESLAQQAANPFIKDESHLWFRGKVVYMTSCQASSAEISGEIGALYKDVCENISFDDFIGILNTLYVETINVDSKVLSGPSLKSLIDPQYDEVVAAIVWLVQHDLLPEKEVAGSLEYLDKLVPTPLRRGAAVLPLPKGFSREKARQLVIAHELGMFIKAKLGKDALRRFDLMSKRSANQIVNLQDKIIEVAIADKIETEVAQAVAENRKLKALLLDSNGDIKPAVMQRFVTIIDEMIKRNGENRLPPPRIPPPSPKTSFEVQRYMPIELEAQP